MPRSKDLDTIAPDDLVVAPDSSTSTKKPKKKKVKSPPPVTETPAPQPSISTTSPITAPGPVTNMAATAPSPLIDKVYEVFGHTKHPFASALVMPKVLNFVEKDDNETILLALRSHWFTNVSWIIVFLFMLTVPSLLRFIPSFGFGPSLQFVLMFAWYLVAFAYAFEQFLSWYFDLYIITDHRVVDIDFNNLLDKKFSEADLGRIQDVTSRVSGVSQTLFNYGTVLIQTAAEQNEIVFEKVPNPDKVTKILQELRHITEAKFGINGGLE